MERKNEKVLVMDFGGQYAQLIARRVREHNVYCEIKNYKISAQKVKENGYKGIIFTGGPNSAYDEKSPKCDSEIFNLGIPVLGICYGAQLMAYMLGGEVKSSDIKEYGKTEVDFEKESDMFFDVKDKSICWMSHTDYIAQVPNGFKIVANTPVCPVAAMQNSDKKLYAVQFHPEVSHTDEGTTMLHNFLYNVCECKGDWKMSSFVEESIKELKEKIGDKKVICGLSGGVDSSVAAVMVHKAIGNNLTCIFVDHGLLRKNEGDEVEKTFKERFDMNIIRVNAQEEFLSKLKGVDSPEQKRKIIGEEFVRTFEREAVKIGEVNYLCQGTIYPDVVESGEGEAATIKSHHNVGGLPERTDFIGFVEPLRDLFKDEVRKAGLELGIDDDLVWRQPFPGPGLAIRVIGDITEEKLEILREADAIFREEVKNADLERSINQYFAVLTNIRSVGVMGDARTYDCAIALRAVSTTDFMTADFSQIPYEVLGKTAARIANEVNGVNRVVYDVTSKPPATIEWE